MKRGKADRVFKREEEEKGLICKFLFLQNFTHQFVHRGKCTHYIHPRSSLLLLFQQVETFAPLRKKEL